jgi:hypothetical protein
MKNEDLEQRAVTALGSDNVSLNELADLTREAETALATAYTAVEEARREGVDPVLSPDPVAARERVGAAEFSYARATALLSRLNERCRQVAAAERNAKWEADYGRVKDERDRLAVELAATYPQTVATLLDLLAALPIASGSVHASPAWRLRASVVACLARSCMQKDSLGSRVTRRRSPGICACRTGSSPAEQRGRRSERARWRHVSIHTAIGTPPTGGEREHETLVKACGTRLGVSLSVRRRNPITYWQA